MLFLEKAIKFFTNFKEGLQEVLQLSPTIQTWFKGIDLQSMNEQQVRNQLASLEGNYFVETGTYCWFESKDELGFSWVKEKNQYTFIVDGEAFDVNPELKESFRHTAGWQIVNHH